MSDKKGVPVSLFVVAIVFMVIFAVMFGFTFFRLNQCIGDRLNNECPTINTNTTD